ncbi:MAG: hypothetical protein NVSMB49_08240 [Ktedonobacteraceae bacterium]
MPSTKHAFASLQQYVLPITLLLLTVFIASCGGSSESTAGVGSSSVNSSSSAPGKSAPSDTSSSQGQQKNNVDPVAQYLIKTLKVSMGVKDTNKAADVLQTWITTTDIRSSSAGITYDQAGNNLYNVSLTFLVQSTLYPEIEHYLRDYAPQNGGQLLSLNESVQDVTNDYIDTQSRLTNLRSEQTRLLTLLGHAQALGDIITIQDKLTDIEGQIETIEAHLKQLNGQVSFYTIVIMLQPLALVVPSSPPAVGWNIGQTFHDAFAASLVFAQGLLTFLVWLLAYSVYLIPLAVLGWFFYRWRRRSLTAMSSPAPTATPPATSV